MTRDTPELLARVKEIGPGCYTERDGGNWYSLAPDHDRLGEDFERRDDARRLIIWLAGDDLPQGWTLKPCGSGHLSYDIDCGQGFRATLWIRAVRRAFPARAAEIEGARS
jgi:hypothetical protein